MFSKSELERIELEDELAQWQRDLDECEEGVREARRNIARIKRRLSTPLAIQEAHHATTDEEGD